MNRQNFFIFGDHNSSEFGLHISGGGTFNAPSRDIETIEIPGRNGSLLIDKGRFFDITVEYPAFITRDFIDNARSARLWLLSHSGYQRLEDTYDPYFFRMARFSGPLDFDTKFLNWTAECTLSFVAKPQRWLKDGEKTITLESGDTLYNAYYPALPLITVYGNGPGTLMIGNYTVTVNSLDQSLVIDCDTQNAYKGTLNKNSTISANPFPKLESGDNVISWSGGITGVEIVPRWWTI